MTRLTLKGLVSMFRSILLGGLVFLLPIGLILVALDKVYATFAPLGVLLHSALFPSSGSLVGPAVFALFVLLLIAFFAGAFVKTRQGVRFSRWLEGATIGRLPLYAYLRPAIADLTGSAASEEAVSQARVVEVRSEDVTTFGVLIEVTSDNRAVVFFPDAPSALSGSVAVVALDKVFPTTMTRADFFMALRGFGAGIGQKVSATDKVKLA